MSIKNGILINIQLKLIRHFVIFLGNCTHKKYKAMKKQVVRLQLNEKKSKGKPHKINELILKTKANLKKGPGNIQ